PGHGPAAGGPRMWSSRDHDAKGRRPRAVVKEPRRCQHHRRRAIPGSRTLRPRTAASIMTPTARSTRLGSVALLTLDHPPVNAMALPVRTALRDALDEAMRDPEVRAVVLTGAGKLFSAGADIREFDSGVSNDSPTLRELIAKIEDAP